MFSIAVVASITKPLLQYLLQYLVIERDLNHANGSTTALTLQSQCEVSRFVLI